MNTKKTVPIRVLAVTNVYPTANSPGTPSVQDQVESLQALGVQVNLLRIDKGSLPSFLKAAWQLFCLNFQKRKFDLVHTFFGHSAFLARCQFRYPIIATYLGSDLLGKGGVNWTDGLIGRTSLLWVDRVITMTEEMKAVSKRHDARVIPFGVNTDIFKPYAREQARQELGLPLEDRLILFPWDPERPEKMFSVVKDALQILQRTDPGVQVIAIHGQPRETIAQYMNACDVLVLTSLYEGSPVAVREAMACNLPIVSVDVGDVAQIIANTPFCSLAERTPQDIAKKTQPVLEKLQRTNGIEKILSFNSHWSAKKVLQLYQETLSRGE
jgi:glycosyltransferase involved in cell wall biosynthesis